MVVKEEDGDGTRASEADTQRRLQESLEQLHAIINALPGMVTVVDRDFTTLVANDAVIDAFGHSHSDEVIGRKCHLVRKGLTSPCPQCGVLQAYETGEPFSRVSTPEEEELMGRATKAYAIPLAKPSGEIWGGVEVIMDVTDLRAAERTARENEERFRTLIEQAADAVYLVDMQGRLVKVNQQASKQTGYSREELLSMTVMDLDQAHPTLEACLQVWSGIVPGGAEQFEGRHLRRDGSVFPVEINSTIIHIQSAPHVLGFVRDITDRRAAEERLEYFRSVVESSTNAVGMTTPEGKHWYQNRAFDEMFGQIGEDPVASLYVDQSVGQEVYRTIKSGGAWSGEVQVYGKDGNVLTVLLNAYSIRNDDGEVIGLVGVHSDLTESKRAETERRKLEEQLQQAQRLESLGVLAGGIAHDFNNLLSGIYGCIELALGTSELHQVRQDLREAVSTLDRARDLTRQLLTFAKGGSPQTKVAPLFPFVREAAEFALSGSSVTCRFDAPEDLWPCEYDANQLGQVIDNIVINAMQAMLKGGTLRISARNVPCGEASLPSLRCRDYVKLMLSDDGEGIAPEVLPFVFDPFFTTKSAGSGLGLATCYSIITRHAGHIGVDSVLGEGTTFTIHLPASDTAVEMSDSGSPLSHAGSGRILIVDDEEVVRRTVARLCSSLGYSTVAAASGEEALRVFDDEIRVGRSFVAVILDLTMPGSLPGPEVLAELRKAKPSLPVFVASGYADDPIMASPANHGFTDSIRKPFRRQELAEFLDRHLKRGA